MAKATRFVIGCMDSTKYFQHSGGNEGFRCQYYGSLSGGNGLVVMVNSDNGAIIQEIVNSIARVYQFRGLIKTRTTHKLSSLTLISMSVLILLILSTLMLLINKNRRRR